jgi:hypothetical protein
MMKSAVNALYKLLWNLDHYCPHEIFPDRERFVIEVSTGPTASAMTGKVTKRLRSTCLSVCNRILHISILHNLHALSAIASLSGALEVWSQEQIPLHRNRNYCSGL